ncbi:TetR/AcrR family transcriptional regulator [Mycobacterium sp.]|uniref:TetR/AcrR family transcriptional regulator n=1 Tax=Mycobacterium sp. TaxID=1785 RepID=UPI002D8ECC47|nr:TetR/AcrR family transcriptional regulator [Mycobacterium sp.]
MPTPTRDTPRRPGRPRDPAVDKAILDATLERLASDGYARLTIGDIAADAGVGRPAIYRRWPNLQALVIDALDALLQQSRTGDPLSDIDEMSPIEALVKVLHGIVPTAVWQRGPGLIGHLIADMGHVPGLDEVARAHLVEPPLQTIVQAMRHLQTRGHIRGDLDLDVFADLLFGSYIAAYLRTGQLDPELPDRVVRAMWPVIATAQSLQPGVRKPPIRP